MLSHINDLVASISKGMNHIYFDVPVKVKITPAASPQKYWAVCAGANGSVEVMTDDKEWYELQERDGDAQIMEEVYQRLRFMQQQQQTKHEEVKL